MADERTPGASEDADDDTALDAWLEYKASRDHFAKWRSDAREDYDFVAGHQWSFEDREILRDANRPEIAFNRIGPVIDAVGGSEVANRQEVRYIPRQVGEAGVNDVLTGAAKWVRDGCDAEDEESDAFVDTAICGVGCTETRIDYDEDPDGKVCIGRVDPLEMFPDAASRKRNYADARHIVRAKMWDRKDAEAQWPDFDWDSAGQGAYEGFDGDDHDGDPHDREAARNYPGQGTRRDDARRKVLILERQWYERETIYRLADPMDPTGQRTATLSEKEWGQLKPRLTMLGIHLEPVKQRRRKYMRAFVCGRMTIEEGESPCPHGFTYKFITAKRDRNNGVFYGLVRAMKDPQRWANKWLSQTMHIINTNAKGGVMAELGAFDSVKQAEKSWANPTAITWVADGAMSGGKIQPKPQTQFPAGIDRLMSFAVESIPDVTGVNQEVMGLADRQQAGILEHQRKQAGLTILAGLFDSLRRYRKEQGRVLLYFIQEYISDGRLIRIVGPEGAKYVPLIRDPELLEFDVIVDEASTSPNQKEQVFGVLMQLLPSIKGAGMPIPPTIWAALVDYLPLPESLTSKLKEIIQSPPPAPGPAQEVELAHKRAQIEELRTEAALNLAKAGAAGDEQRVAMFSAMVDMFNGMQPAQPPPGPAGPPMGAPPGMGAPPMPMGAGPGGPSPMMPGAPGVMM